MIYPKYLADFSDVSFMRLPKSYQEYFIRAYYYVTSDNTHIPDTVPVEHIEDFIVEHMNAQQLWQAKGFAAARECDSQNTNHCFYGDARFFMILVYVCKLWYKKAVSVGWITPDCTKEEFESHCPFFLNHRLTL